MLNQFARKLLPRHPVRTMRRIYDSTVPESESRRLFEAQTFWSASGGDPAIRDLSHCLGSGRWTDEDRWRRIGEAHLSMFRTLRQLAPSQQPPRSALEWGPGGGANLLALSSEIPALYGVDISRANLAECSRLLESRGVTGFRPVPIAAGKPEAVLDVVREPVDFFLSTAVYQHFPSRQYGLRVTALANRLLAVGGVALIQIRYDDNTPRFRTKVRNYGRNAVTFTSYGISEFWQALVEAAFDPIAVILQPQVNYAYFFSRKAGSDV